MPMAIHWHSKALVVSFVGKINRLGKGIGELKIEFLTLILKPEKESLFLDIACFFAGERKEFVIRIPDDSSFMH